MKKITVNENQRGLLFRNGRFEKLLLAGKYRLWGGRRLELFSLGEEIRSASLSPETVLSNPALRDAVVSVTVEDCRPMLHFTDGRFCGILDAGRHFFWKADGEHEFRPVDITKPEADPEIPRYVFGQIPRTYFREVAVPAYFTGYLRFDGGPCRVLEPGVYFFWQNGMHLDLRILDSRLQTLELSGQELLTKDRVTVRLNFVCSFRTVGGEKIFSVAEDCKEQFRMAAQLILRDAVGACRLDDLLENREEISRNLLEKLREKGAELCLEVRDGGVKDIILPGEIREIMNSVLAAEKRAQANVITRREEVASTRSLLNTARLMEENKTLCKLKEMEYVERICENVGSVNLNGGGNLLAQLTDLFRGNSSS